MRAGVDHIIVNVNDYAAAKKFYSWLMPLIGYPKAMSYDQAQTDLHVATSRVAELATGFLLMAIEAEGPQATLREVVAPVLVARGSTAAP